jgi:hypothetical protein
MWAARLDPLLEFLQVKPVKDLPVSGLQGGSLRTFVPELYALSMKR